MDEASTFPPLPADYPWRTEHAVEGIWHCIQMQYYYGTSNPEEGAVKLPEGQRQKVTLIATGAMTNVALLLRTHPEITPMLEAIVLMGGGFSRGNTRPLVEFNMETDPEAASIVFNAGLGHHTAPFGMSHHKAHMLPHDAPGHQGPPAADTKGAPADAAHAQLHGDGAEKPTEASALAKGFLHQDPAVPLADLPKAIKAAIGVAVSVPGATAGDPAVSVPVVMLPLEVTHTALVTPAVVARIQSMEAPGAKGQGTSRFASLIASLLMFFRESYAHVEGMPEPPLHDPCAVAAVIDPSKFNLIHTHVFVDTHSLVSPGATVADLRNVYRLPKNAKNTYVATSMEVGWFWEQMLSALERANDVCLMNSQPSAAQEQPPSAKKARAQ